MGTEFEGHLGRQLRQSSSFRRHDLDAGIRRGTASFAAAGFSEADRGLWGQGRLDRGGGGCSVVRRLDLVPVTPSKPAAERHLGRLAGKSGRGWPRCVHLPALALAAQALRVNAEKRLPDIAVFLRSELRVPSRGFWLAAPQGDQRTSFVARTEPQPRHAERLLVTDQ